MGFGVRPNPREPTQMIFNTARQRLHACTSSLTVRRDDIIDALILWGARLAARLIRLLRLGAGTSLPGRVADRIRPGLIERRASALPGGVVLVSGTNGKTTTAAMLRTILRAAGHDVIANESGANMTGGVASALLLGPREGTVAVMEADEAVLPDLTRRLHPRLLILTNVFRDQLDRFGEPEHVVELLGAAARALPPDADLIVNADDPLLWEATRRADPVGFGVRTDSPGSAAPTGPDTGSFDGSSADGEPAVCPACSGPVRYASRTIGHLGPARCRSCGWRSPDPEVKGTVLAESGVGRMVLEEDEWILTLPLGGVHNAYNAMAALAAADVLGVRHDDALRALARFHPRFGRAEVFDHGSRRLWLGLIKNPAGTGAISRSVAADPSVGAAVIAVNDLDADGRDVSWIWDAEFEGLAEAGIPLVASGRRAEDVALRLKYAGQDGTPTEHELMRAVDSASAMCGPGQMVAVLATYTAMLEARRQLLSSRVARVEDRGTGDLAA